MSLAKAIQIRLGNAVKVTAKPVNTDGAAVPVSNVSTTFTNLGVVGFTHDESDPLAFTLEGTTVGKTTLNWQANDDPADANDVVAGSIDIEVIAEAVAVEFEVSDEFAVQPAAVAAASTAATGA
jgi:hypothetical protein